MKQTTATLKQVYLNSKAALCIGLALMTALAPSLSLALEVKLNSTLNLRTSEGSSLTKVGRLAAGSIVSIPDQYAVRVNGQVDFEQTLNKWLATASTLGGSDAPGLRTFSGEKKDFFFPIKVVKEAPGSVLGNKETYMVALHYLQRKGALLETTEGTDLHTLTSNESAPSGSTEAAPSDAAPTEVAPSTAATSAVAPQSSFEASAVSTCTNCNTQSLHPLALHLQLALDSHLRRDLEKMNRRTTNHTHDAAKKFEKTCGMQIEHFASALQREIAASSLRSTVPNALNSTMMLGLMTQETNGNCRIDGDGNRSIGLFQVMNSRYSKAALRHPITNARAALENLESKRAALSKDFDFNKMTEEDRMRILISAYNGGQRWVIQAKQDLEQFNRKHGTSLNSHKWEDLRIFYFRRHLKRAGDELHVFGTVRGKDQRRTDNTLKNLAYTENLIPRPQAARGVTLQDAWNSRIRG